MKGRAVVISDLHLGPGGELEVFQCMPAICKWLARLAEDPLPIELVLAGDTFDFLQFSDYQGFAPDLATKRFHAIAAHNEEFMHCLADFAARGNHEVTLLVGNHDPEMALPEVRGALESKLGRRGSVRYDEPLVPGAAASWGIWGRSLLDGTVWIVHGDRWDPQNAIDRDTLFATGTVELPAGSKLVYQVLSKIQPRFPWVYELKPELEVVLPLLIYLDPKRTFGFLRDNFGLTTRMLKGLINTELPSGELLGSPSGRPEPIDSTIDLPRHLAQQLAGTLQDENPATREILLAELASLQPANTRQGSLLPTLAAHGGAHRWLLRTWLRYVRATDDFLDQGQADELNYRARPHLPGKVRTLIAGHTHGPRALDKALPAYFNSGTWIPVGRLDNVDMKSVIDRLELNHPWPRVVPQTFVEVAASGTVVLRGHELG